MGRIVAGVHQVEWRCRCPHRCLLGVILERHTLQLRVRQRIYLVSGHRATIEAICPRCGALSRLALPYTTPEAC